MKNKKMKLLIVSMFMFYIHVPVSRTHVDVKIKNVTTKAENSKLTLCSGYNMLELTVSGDSIKGRHCFVFDNGERIDCCEEEGYTIFLKKIYSKRWSGILKSCYSNDDVKVELTGTGKNKYRFMLKNYDLAPYINFVLCK